MKLISIAFTAIIILAYKHKYYEGEPPEIKNAITIYRNGNTTCNNISFLQNKPYSSAEVVFYWLSHVKKPKQQNILCNSKNIHLLLKIILRNQVELNPGPINSSNNDTKYPCYVCNESVLWTEKGVACDRCDQWFHTKCINMSTQTYIGLDNSANWFCNKCESPNSLNSIYQSVHIDSISSKNSLLNSTNFSENGNSSLNNLGSPIASSSPKKGGKYKIKRNINSLRVLSVNFQSARSKSHETALLIE
jgi:hypothetical protein